MNNDDEKLPMVEVHVKKTMQSNSICYTDNSNYKGM